MKKFLKFLSKPFLGKKAFQPLFKGLFWLSLKGLNFGGGSTWSDSGEEWVIKYFAGLQLVGNKEVVFFDVGANNGEYAMAALKILKRQKIGAKIFCFEPSKQTFKLLTEKTSAFPEIKCFNIALGEHTETAPLYSDFEASGLASLYNRDLKNHGVAMKEQERVQVETLENFCRAQNISSIDFLKLDVEGNEYKVLLGAGNMLKENKIKFIQFEFGGTDIDARIFFRDFFNLLSPNYILYRILKNGLQPIKAYKEIDEIFITTNYLAILK
jgi:FkbM family methyltransferase